MSNSRGFKKYVLIPAAVIMIFSFLSFFIPGYSYAAEEEDTVGQEAPAEETQAETGPEEVPADEAVPVEEEALIEEGSGDTPEQAEATGLEEYMTDADEPAEEPIEEPGEEIPDGTEEEAEAVPEGEYTIEISYGTGDGSNIIVGQPVSFSAAIVGIVAVELYWDFGDGSDFLGEEAVNTFEADGSYEIILTVEDINGFMYSQTASLAASEPAIEISFTTDDDGYVATGEPVSFSAVIEDLEAAELYWDFGDGSDFLGPEAVNTYESDGNYEVILTVKNINGFSYTRTAEVHASDHDPATTEWWVSDDAETSAADFADGNTSETPVSIDSVLAKIVDGDTLYFLPGIYTGTYTESTDATVSLDGIGTGTESNPIAFIGYDGTVFDGQGEASHAFSVTDPLSYLGFYNFTFTGYTGSAIYIDNPVIDGIEIVDNTFSGNATAIEIDMDSGLNIENNIIVDSAVGIDISADDAAIKHNIIVDNDTAVIADGSRADNVADYNNLWGNTIDYQGIDPGTNDISVDPGFADKENLDFSIPEDSPPT